MGYCGDFYTLLQGTIGVIGRSGFVRVVPHGLQRAIEGVLHSFLGVHARRKGRLDGDGSLFFAPVPPFTNVAVFGGLVGPRVPCRVSIFKVWSRFGDPDGLVRGRDHVDTVLGHRSFKRGPNSLLLF